MHKFPVDNPAVTLSTSGYQSSTETTRASDIYERRHIQTYVSILKRKNGEKMSPGRRKVSCRFNDANIILESLQERVFRDIRASFCWKNIYSTTMERGEVSLYLWQTRSAQSVFRDRVCAHRWPLFGFAGNEKSQSAWNNERTWARESESDGRNEVKCGTYVST